MKPREWWVLVFSFKQTAGGNGRFEAFDYKLSSNDAIHVIEKSAYDEAVAALKRIGKCDEDPYACPEMARETLRKLGETE